MGNFEDWQCDSCHEWNESVAKWKLDYKAACKYVEDRDATIAQQAQELQAKVKRIAELEIAICIWTREESDVELPDDEPDTAAIKDFIATYAESQYE